MTAAKPPKTSETPAAKRLRWLIAEARAALFWEGFWRGLLPVFFVVGIFLCVSWTGLWLEVPHLARIAGVVVFGAALVFALARLVRLRRASRPAALARIDLASGLSHRPAAVLDDALANPGTDPATRALWELHRKRAEAQLAAMRAGRPSPRLVDRDTYALRGALLVALVAFGILAGPEKYARVAAAFDWRQTIAPAVGTRLDAWIDPPAYTGKAPVILAIGGPNAGSADHPQKIEAPFGSTLIVRASAADATVEADAGLVKPTPDPAAAEAAAPKPDPKAETEQRLVLRGDAKLKIRSAQGATGVFAITAIPDKPPSIALVEVPKANLRGSLTLAYQISDDYGVVGAEATFAKPSVDGKPTTGRSLVEAPHLGLSLPPGPGSLGEAETTSDLSDHPWAGARVTMTLATRDEGGNEGRSDPVEVTLPQKPFVKPLARALVEQRRNLVLDPDHRGHVETALEALMIAPDVFDTGAGIYLGLRFAGDSLKNARTDEDLVAVADYLWEMAQRIENGDLSDAERDLRTAEQQLREALQRHAPEDEIRKLTENLRAALDKFMRELAERQSREQNQQQAERSPNGSRTITPKDLQAMLDRMQEMARSGNLAEAQKMLEQLQNILENLKTARRRNGDPQAREMQQALNELDRMTREQQELRDQTYRQGRGAKKKPGAQGQQDGARGRQNPGEQSDEDEDDDADNGDPSGAPGSALSEEALQQRQQALRDRLKQLQQRMKQAGRGQPGLDDADGAMDEAQGALGQGKDGRGKAVDAQGRALEAMRRGAQQMAQQMQQGGGDGDPSDEADDGGDPAPGTPRRADRGTNDDPLGRPMASDPGFNPRSRYDPLGVPAAQRAQRVLEELRRRLSDPARPRDETDYLERLLRPY